MFWCEHYSKKLGWQLNKKKRNERKIDLMWTFPIHWLEELWCYTFDQQNPGKEPESEESGRRMELRLNSEEHREDWSSIFHVINGMQHHGYKIHCGPLPDEKPDLLCSDPQVKKVTPHWQEQRPQRRNEKTPGKL